MSHTSLWRSRRPVGHHSGTVMIAMIGGLAAAIVGGLVWALIVYTTNYEVGYVAWGIGALVGFVMAGLAKSGNAGLGVSAGGLAAVGLIVGKLLIIQWAVPAQIAKEIMADPNVQREVLTWVMFQNKEFEPTLQAALEESDEQRSAELDLEIAGVVSQRHSAMSPSEVQAMADAHAAAILAEISYTDRLIATLAAWDVLWFGLAIFTAFRIASNPLIAKTPEPQSPSPVA